MATGLRVVPGRIRQWFAQSTAVTRRTPVYDALAAEVFGGQRLVEVDGIRFLILVCGENNVLANRGRELTVELRHEAPGQTLAALHAIDYQAAFSPAHTEFGNDGKMHQRWRWLSRPRHVGESRHCLFVTNIERGGADGRSMYAFRDQELIELSAKRNWPKDQPWTVDLVEV